MKNLIKKPECQNFHSIIRLLIFLLFFSFIVSKASAQSSTFNVLYLNSYNIGYSWSDSITRGIKKALNRRDIKLYIECLDAKRFGQEKFDVFSGYLVKKYKNIHFDAIITSDNDALDFVIKYGNTLFPKTPVVFCGINNPEDYKLEETQIYGYTESTDPNKAVSVMTRMIPEAKSLLFVTDNTTSGIIIKKEYERLRKLFPYVKINFISDIDVDELIKTVKKGDKGDLVYLMRINRDKYGNILDYLDFFRRIANASLNPVFADDDAIIGHGVVGGNANRGSTQGYYSGLLALQLLKDTAYANISRINIVREEYIFDYKQLRKYKIDTKKLPPGSIIINKPIEYLKYIFSLIIIVFILSAIIIVLTIINRKRLLAERKVKEQLLIINERNLLLEQSHKQLSNLNSELEEANIQLQKLNITLKEAKQKAEESEKLKSSFLANLSHEIRTPLNAILGFSSLLIEPNVRYTTKEKYFGIIQSNSDSLLVLIDDILDFSKIEAGQVQIRTEPVIVNEIFEELYALFKQKCNNKVNLVLSDFAIKNRVVLNTDKIRFKQILSNFLTNAFKFTEKGFIEMGFETVNESEIRFYVKDTGIGIDQKFHKTIFERFRKLEDEKTKLYSGSGLGLAICKKLTELLGGKIWVDGEPGKGSTFHFTLPDYSLIGNIIYEQKNFPKSIAEYNWKGKLIAIAEDEDTNYLLLEQILTSHGAELIRFIDGISIVDHFVNMKENNIRLILMDLKMPGMDGIQAMEQIRKKYPSTVIIAQTAYALSEDIDMIKEKGFDDFITKPINMDILKEKIDKYLCQSLNLPGF